MTRHPLFVLALAALGCAQSPEQVQAAADSAAGRTVVRHVFDPPLRIEPGETVFLGLAQAFPTPVAQPDSGILHFRFRVPTTDNRGTCEYPEPDSAYPGDAIWCRVFRERRVYEPDGRGGTTVYDETHADSFPVRRGEIVTYWRRVPVDTFLCNFRLFNGTKGSCRVYAKQIVEPSNPPTPEVLP